MWKDTKNKMDKILTPKRRQEIITDIAKKYHSNGLKHLEIIGHFQKYTPFYHFKIGEQLPEQNNITITELFGRDYKNEIMPFSGGIRTTYQGTVNGLSRIVLQNINSAHTTYNMEPAFSIYASKEHITPELTARFDAGLIYLENIMAYANPKSFDLDWGNFEDKLRTINML